MAPNPQRLTHNEARYIGTLNRHSTERDLWVYHAEFMQLLVEAAGVEFAAIGLGAELGLQPRLLVASAPAERPHFGIAGGAHSQS